MGKLMRLLAVVLSLGGMIGMSACNQQTGTVITNDESGVQVESEWIPTPESLRGASVIVLFENEERNSAPPAIGKVLTKGTGSKDVHACTRGYFARVQALGKNILKPGGYRIEYVALNQFLQPLRMDESGVLIWWHSGAAPWEVKWIKTRKLEERDFYY